MAAELLRPGRGVDPRRRPRRRPHRRAREPAGRGRRRRRRRRSGARADRRRRALARRRQGARRRRRRPGRDGLGRRRRPRRSSTPWPSIVPVAVGLDHRGGELAVHGWTEASGVSLAAALARFASAAAFVITDIDRDGLLGGPDVDGLAAAVAATDVPVIASGGVGTLDDVRGPRRDRRAARHHHRPRPVRGPLHASPRPSAVLA